MVTRGFPDEFNRAEELLKLGECPAENDLKFICETDPIWLDYLGPSEREKALECWEEYQES